MRVLVEQFHALPTASNYASQQPLTQHKHSSSKAGQVFKAVVGGVDDARSLADSGFADEAHLSSAIPDVAHQVLAHTLHGAVVQLQRQLCTGIAATATAAAVINVVAQACI